MAGEARTGASVVQAGTAGPGTEQAEEELNHPSGFLEARAQGLVGAAGNSAARKAFLDPGEGWGGMVTRKIEIPTS